MNAADQRHLTPWLAGLCILLAGLWLALFLGWGRSVQWRAPAHVESLPAASSSSGDNALSTPLEAYAEIWQRPLFTTDREPVAVNQSGADNAVDLDNMLLTGVILAPGLHMALLSGKDGKQSARVVEGVRMDDADWVLQELKPRSAVFSGHGKTVHLKLQEPGEGPSVPTSSASRNKPAHARSTRDNRRSHHQRPQQHRPDGSARAGER